MTPLKVLLVAGALCASVAAQAQSYVWQVSDGTHQLLVGGTIHMLKPSDYPLPAEYRAAVAAADTLVFETDMDVVQKPAFSRQLQQAMMLPKGSNLQDQLDSKTWARLSAYSARKGVPLAPMQAFQPAFVALALTMIEGQRLGFGDGIDQHYTAQAKAQGKATAVLETPQEQLGFIVGMTELEPNVLINAALDDLAQMAEMFKTMTAQWCEGDADALFELMGQPMRDKSPQLYNLLLTERNKNWLPHFKQMLATPEVEFVLVGALHLAGPDSVLELLQKEGLSVSRYQLP
jgi:uncharacterized protein YbaP (TraB family)